MIITAISITDRTRSIWQSILTSVVPMLAALPAARKIYFCTIIFVKVTIIRESTRRPTVAETRSQSVRLTSRQQASACTGHVVCTTVSTANLGSASDYRVSLPTKWNWQEDVKHSGGDIFTFTPPYVLIIWKDHFSAQAQGMGEGGHAGEKDGFMGSCLLRSTTMPEQATLGFCAREAVSKLCFSARITLQMLTSMFKDPIRTAQ